MRTSGGYTGATNRVQPGMVQLIRCALIMGGLTIGVAWSLAGCSAPKQSASIAPTYPREDVQYVTHERAGTIVVDPQQHYLYLVEKNGRALRYEVGVGAEGFAWSGVATVRNKQDWPEWYPTSELIGRQPDIKPAMSELQNGGMGMVAGLNNPLGARALYLWQGNKDTLYRIHGTNEPWTIGTNVSSGCIRLTNDDIIDLYDRVPIGTKVVVLPSKAG
jgi:lipoprotein-anchoring transpeptidase ErfK/SrfK